MDTNENINIKVIDEGDGTRRVKRGLDDIASSAERTDKFVSTLRRTLSTLGLAFGAAELIRFADAGTQVRNILKTATESTAELDFAIASVQATAIATGADIVGLASAYDGLSAAGDNFGATQQQIAIVTDTLAKAFSAEGKSGTEAASAVDALSRSLITGQADMRGMITLFKQSDDLTAAMAAQFNLTTSEFITMVEAGRVSSEQLFKSLIGANSAMNETFANTNRTIAQTMNSLINSLIVAIDNSTTLRTTINLLGGALLFLANNLDIIIPLIIFFSSLWAVNAALGMLEAFRASQLLSAGLLAVRTSTGLLSAAWGILNALLLASPIGITLTVLVALGTAIVIAYQRSETFRAIVGALWDIMVSWGNWIIDQLIPELQDLWLIITTLAEGFGILISAIGELLGVSSAAAAEIENSRESYDGLNQSVSRTTESMGGFRASLDSVSETTEVADETATDYRTALDEATDSSIDLGSATGSLSRDLDDVAGSFSNAAQNAREFSTATRDIETGSGGGSRGGGGGTFTFQDTVPVSPVIGGKPGFGVLQSEFDELVSQRDEKLNDLINTRLEALTQKEETIADSEQKQIAAVNDPTKQRPVYVNVQIVTPNPNAFRQTEDQVNRQIGRAISSAFAHG